MTNPLPRLAQSSRLAEFLFANKHIHVNATVIEISSCFSKIQIVLQPLSILSHICEFCLSAEGGKALAYRLEKMKPFTSD